MICGIVDMGANTVRLSIYKIEDKKVRLLINKKEMAGLSSYSENGAMSQKGIRKACSVIDDFKSILKNFGIDDFYVFATASLRNITNAEEVRSEIYRHTGVAVEILTGEEEARLDYVGAICMAGICDGVLVDIGGGSTEIIEIGHGAVLSVASMPVGSLNLYLKHVKELFPSDKKSGDIKLEVVQELKKLNELNKSGNMVLYGVGGTVRALAKLNNEIYDMPSDNNAIDVKNLDEIMKLFRKSNRVVLKTILQTAPDRVLGGC
jgi:exopolyphosphatase/guanosine-5'-triphosphate,3'-diphosphate pyrophosphatase